MHNAGHTVSIVNPAPNQRFAQSQLMRTKNDKVEGGLIPPVLSCYASGTMDTSSTEDTTIAITGEESRCPDQHAHPRAAPSRHSRQSH